MTKSKFNNLDNLIIEDNKKALKSLIEQDIVIRAVQTGSHTILEALIEHYDLTMEVKDAVSFNNIVQVALLARNKEILKLVMDHAPEKLLTEKNIAGNNAFDQIILTHFYDAFDIVYPRYAISFNDELLAKTVNKAIRFTKGTEMIEKLYDLGIKINKDTIELSYYYDRGDVIEFFKSKNPNLFTDLSLDEEDYVGYLTNTKDQAYLNHKLISKTDIAMRLHQPLEQIQKLYEEYYELWNDSEDLLWADKFGTTIIHDAAHYGRIDVIEWLATEKKIQINWDQQDNYGNTALHNAIFAANVEVAIRLLELGSNPSLANDHGDTPVSYAIEDLLKKVGDDKSDISKCCKLLAYLARPDIGSLDVIEMIDSIVSNFDNPKENPLLQAILKELQYESSITQEDSLDSLKLDSAVLDQKLDQDTSLCGEDVEQDIA